MIGGVVGEGFVPVVIVGTVDMGDGPPRCLASAGRAVWGARRHHVADGTRRCGQCRAAADRGVVALPLRGCAGSVVVCGFAGGEDVGGAVAAAAAAITLR